jgi:hypothetical protein
MIIAAPTGNLFYGVIVGYMWYVLEKEQVTLSIGWLSNVITKQGTCCCKHSRGSEHLDINISKVADRMPKPSCRGMCMVMMDMVIQGFDDRSDESAGMLMPTSNTMAARQQGQ